MGKDEKAQAEGQITDKARLKKRVRQGHYGDLRLFGLSAGCVLLFILNLLFQSVESPLMATNMPVEESVVFTQPVFAAPAKEPSIAEAMFDESVYYGMELVDSSNTGPAERPPEQKEQLIP